MHQVLALGSAFDRRGGLPHAASRSAPRECGHASPDARSTPPLNRMRRDRPTQRGAATDAAVLGTRSLLPQKTSQMPRDSRVHCIGQADLAKRVRAPRGAPHRSPPWAGSRRAKFGSRFRSAAALPLIVPPYHARAAPQNRHRVLARFVAGFEQTLLRDPALLPQCVKLQRIELCAFRRKLLLEEARQGEIDIIAAEKDVLAHRNALELQLAAAFGNGGDQREVGSGRRRCRPPE